MPPDLQGRPARRTAFSLFSPGINASLGTLEPEVHTSIPEVFIWQTKSFGTIPEFPL